VDTKENIPNQHGEQTMKESFGNKIDYLQRDNVHQIPGTHWMLPLGASFATITPRSWLGMIDGASWSPTTASECLKTNALTMTVSGAYQLPFAGSCL
jgi:hypothetical protein